MAGCATECAVASDEAKPVTIATVAPDSATPRVSPAVVTIVVTQQASRSFAPAERDTGPSHRGADASLQVLNSVFRI
ncbi:MAG TPA: hypothetical protein VFN10_15495 [Thermoanaerobaculia bacterium]|nr:hypothetical protein [Thermoanaerobaculia bacterium]